MSQKIRIKELFGQFPDFDTISTANQFNIQVVGAR